MNHGNRHRVVIAAGDDEVRESLKDLLRLDGYQVMAVHSGAEALSLLCERGAPCVLVMDLRNPMAEGWSVLARLAQFPQELKPHHVIAVAPAYEAQTLERRFGCSIIDQLTDPAALLSIVKRHCEPSPTHRLHE
jgi:CheY-like chemotaxis protein